MTKASCLAALGDEGAIALARTLTDGPADRWTFEVLSEIATRLDRPDIATEAQALASIAPEREGGEDDSQEE